MTDKPKTTTAAPRGCFPPDGTADNTVHVLGTPSGARSYWLWKDKRWWFAARPVQRNTPRSMAKCTWFYVGPESVGIADRVKEDTYAV